MACNSTSVSVYDVLHVIRPKMLMGNGLLFLNAILMGVVVGIGAYAPRYRRHPVIGVLFLGATTMFLPVVSSVAASVGSTGLLMRTIFKADSGVYCSQYGHLFMIFLWTGLVVVIGINASEVVASDAREGRNLAPPIVLTGTAVWAAYLTFSTLSGLYRDGNAPVHFLEQSSNGNAILGLLFLIMFAKLLLKYYAFYKAQRSLALGQNPRLIAGYMSHLQYQEEGNNTRTATGQQREIIDDEHVAAVPIPPALVVMGEDNVKVEKQPHGYRLKQMPAGECDRLVTLDSVWKSHDLDLLQSSVSQSQPKDLCFSFSSFKLLRCRFAKYATSGASFTKAQKFFRDALLQGAGAGYERVFAVVAKELSFIHDYYYSALPICYSHHLLLPIFSVILSLCTIVYCLFLMILFIEQLAHGVQHSQMACSSANGTCFDHSEDYDPYFFNPVAHYFGGKYSDVVATYLVAVVLVLAETKVILFYMSSNWTKVTLIYHYINRDSWVRSPIIKKCIGLVFKYCSGKLVNVWNDKMKQCSILDLHPWKIPLLGRHLHLHARAKKVKVPSAVKATIFEVLKEKCLSFEQGGSSLLRHVGPPSFPTSCYAAPEFISDNGFLNACDGKSPAYTILAWHIATTIFEESHPQPSDPDECHKISATHLSRYCAYLVGYCPELLRDDDEWCKSLYDDVKKDAVRVLSGAQGTAYDQLIELLSGSSNHEVLRDGASLGNQLVESNMGWEALARFWSDMILYVAPSDNLEAHAEAIDRGGELITLLWELLNQAGINTVGSLDTDGAAATTDAGV